EFNLIDRSPWQNNIITITKCQFSILRMHCATAFMHKDHFIRVGILIKIIFGSALRSCQHDMTIVIYQHWHPALQKFSAGVYMKSLKATMLQHFFFSHLRTNIHLWFCFYYLCWWMTMIKQ